MTIIMRQGPEKVSWDVLQFDEMIKAGILYQKAGYVAGGDISPPGVPNVFYTELIEGEIVCNTRKVSLGEQKTLNEAEREQVIHPFRAMFGENYHILLKHPFSVSFKSTVMPRLMVISRRKADCV